MATNDPEDHARALDAETASGADLGGERPTPTAKPLRPRDAGTLIIARRDGGRLRILMGKRNARHVFMADRWVFPGGRVDLADYRAAVANDLAPAELDKLRRGRLPATPAKARALAKAAIRETFEEAGLIFGAPAEGASSRAPGWKPFFAAGFAPALAPLAYVLRAITPPQRPRRFDARFFLVDAEAALGDPDDFTRASGELLGLEWLEVAQALKLNVPRVTVAALKEVDARLGPAGEGAARPVPFYYAKHGRFVAEMI